MWAASRPAGLHAGVATGLAALAACIVVSANAAPDALAAAAACLVTLLCAKSAASLQRDEVRYVFGAWAAAALLSCAIAACQYFGLAHFLDPLVNASSVGQAFANLRQRNQFASLTALAMAALLFWPGSRPKPAGAVLAMCVLAAGNSMSASRTGLFELVMLAVLAACWGGAGRRHRLVLCLAAGLAYAAAAVLLPMALAAATGVTAPNVWGRIAAADSCSSRTVLWDNVVDLIALKPWTGWGWGALDQAHYATLYPGERFCDILDNAHNLPLHLAVELGIPATLLLCGLFAWMVLKAAPWRETDTLRQAAWAALAVIGLHSMLEYPLWYGPFQMAFGLCLGILWGRCRDSAGAVTARLQPVLAAGIVGVIGHVVWDYQRVSQVYLPEQSRRAAYRDGTLDKIRGSWLFRDQVRFAEIGTTALTPANAQWTFDSASALLLFSPEPRIVEKLLDSALVLGRHDDLLAHAARFRAAYPVEYAQWIARNTGVAAPAPMP
ncbi:PglL family O-oligosaccharyltransferase [uncultured Ramlibacter sp.]|uniref:PglL family O-oligosaccharyltransferase n=1 Tax=uncultured Ramlibacter sp. TaxID=260755 RepID=UPI002624516C|nr:Wzy polymerase domain-containing protein [uncultured Ramlibacter sp.]